MSSDRVRHPIRITLAIALLAGAGLAGCAASHGMRPDARDGTGLIQVTPPQSSGRVEVALNALRELGPDASAEAMEEGIEHAQHAISTIGVREEAVAARLHLIRSLQRLSAAQQEAGVPSRRWASLVDLALLELDRLESLIPRDDPASRSLAYGDRAALLARKGDREAAFQANHRASLAALAAGRPELVAQWSAQRGRWLMEDGQADAALSAFRAARTALQGVGVETPEGERLTLARAILFPLSDLLLRPGEVDEARLREVQASLEELRLAEVAEFFGDACLAGLPRQRLDSIPGTVVLYPILLPDRIELIVGRAGRLHRRTARVGLADPFAALRRLRAGLQDPTSFRYRRPAAQFYDWLIRPLGELSPKDGETLVLVPTFEWMGLPLSALWNAERKRFLIEEMAVAITPGLELTSPSPLATERARLLAVGLTTEVDGFSKLASVDAELESVTAFLPGERLVGEAYTSDALRSALGSGQFDIVHVASHGVFDERTDEGFIVTADGRVLIGELADVLRSTRFSPETRLELLVLSACETAASSPRAAFGLAGVAIRSGAASAVASLWRVSDRATAELVDRFYRELTSGPVSRAEALRRAQRGLRADPAWMHPFFWSPFVLINDWL